MTLYTIRQVSSSDMVLSRGRLAKYRARHGGFCQLTGIEGRAFAASASDVIGLHSVGGEV